MMVSVETFGFMPGQEFAMANQLDGSFSTPGINGQARHIRGLTGWMVQF